jgi:hypothetical protein
VSESGVEIIFSPHSPFSLPVASGSPRRLLLSAGGNLLVSTTPDEVVRGTCLPELVWIRRKHIFQLHGVSAAEKPSAPTNL